MVWHVSRPQFQLVIKYRKPDCIPYFAYEYWVWVQRFILDQNSMPIDNCYPGSQATVTQPVIIEFDSNDDDSITDDEFWAPTVQCKSHPVPWMRCDDVLIICMWTCSVYWPVFVSRSSNLRSVIVNILYFMWSVPGMASHRPPWMRSALGTASRWPLDIYGWGQFQSRRHNDHYGWGRFQSRRHTDHCGWGRFQSRRHIDHYGWDRFHTLP